MGMRFFLGLEMDEKYSVVEGNIFTTVWSKTKNFNIGGIHFIFGQIDSMRKEWFEYNESMRKYCEEEEDDEWIDVSWNDYIWGEFYVDEEKYYIAQG